MPISPDYSWEETEETITVRVLIPGICRQKPDVFFSAAVLKVNASPYFLLLDLFKDVDEKKSSAIKDDKGVSFKLVKRKSELWGRVAAEGEKGAVLERRKASIDQTLRRLEEAREARKSRKEVLEKEASQKQFDLERQKRSQIESEKELELAEERSKLLQWQTNEGLSGPGRKHNNRLTTVPEAVGSDCDEDEDEGIEEIGNKHHEAYYGRGQWGETSNPQTEFVDDGCCEEESQSDDRQVQEGYEVWSDEELSEGECNVAREPVGPLTSMREPLEPVPIQFTKLETPHLPAREHREEELKLYKKYAQSNSELADEVDLGERMPAFLKDKGDSLFQQGNFKGAVNAYSRAIDLDERQTMCFANRAACYLKMGEQRSCIADCTKALGQLEASAKEANPGQSEKLSKTTCRVLCRRATARCEVDDLEEAASDFKEALKYDPDNDEIQDNLAEVTVALQPPDAPVLMQRASARFKKGDHAGAREAYSTVLRMKAIDKSCKQEALANRALCHLVLEQFEKAVLDCGNAIELALNGTGVTLGGLHDCVKSGIPEVMDKVRGAESYRGVLSRLLCRRGAALGHLKEYGGALCDYESAMKLHEVCGDTKRVALIEADIEKIRNVMVQGSN
ncbi:hypothetical protein BSKO_12120 [Bryopsis sp. KO-2023]|nr:hypothetical protein BSKO_12120 [Bryopsis sp. KO-2023]